MSRDYCAEMRHLIDTHTDTGPYTPPIAATEIVGKLRATDPDLLTGWLDAQAERFVWQAINDRDRSRRAHTLHHGRRRAFHAATEAHDSGDSAGLRRFLDAPYTVGDGTRRPLAALTRDDLLFVAAGYDRRVRDNSMKAAFFAALAKKVRKGTTVEDHFTEDQLSAMYESVAA